MRVSVILLFCVSVVFGQSYGEINGIILDPSEAPLAGVQVTVQHRDTGLTRRMVSTEAGYYAAPFLPPGTYEVRAELAGFKAGTRREVLVQVASTARVNLILNVGDVTETVEVKESAELVNSENEPTKRFASAFPFLAAEPVLDGFAGLRLDSPDANPIDAQPSMYHKGHYGTYYTPALPE
jgi:hypothetical protein